MPNLPKPRLRRSSRARDGAPQAPAAAEPRVEQISATGLRWINVERPGPNEQAWLEEHFDFHPLAYEDVQSRNQRPKIDEYDDYLFIVLHFPVFDKNVGRLNAGELDIFVGAGYLLYRIVDNGFDYCFPMLSKIGNKLDRLETDIFEGRSEEDVRDISNVKLEILNFRKVIRPQRTVLRD